MEKKDEISRKIQERLYLLQQIKNESESIQRRIVELELVQSELNKTTESLEFLSKLHEDKIEGLMNLGGGIFAYAEVKNFRKILLDVGAGVIIEKDVRDAIEYTKKKIQSLRENMVKLENILQKLLEEAEKVQKEINELSKEVKK